jgi:hypothetical protein
MTANWYDYETHVVRHFQQLFPDAVITPDTRRIGFT